MIGKDNVFRLAASMAHELLVQGVKKFLGLILTNRRKILEATYSIGVAISNLKRSWDQ